MGMPRRCQGDQCSMQGGWSCQCELREGSAGPTMSPQCPQRLRRPRCPQGHWAEEPQLPPVLLWKMLAG